MSACVQARSSPVEPARDLPRVRVELRKLAGGYVEHITQRQQAQARAERIEKRQPGRPVVARIRGGSTITQQLAKNLFLSGERTMLRKGQELILTKMLEQLLSKERILEIYLNSVEWGEGVFGAPEPSPPGAGGSNGGNAGGVLPLPEGDGSACTPIWKPSNV